MRAAARRLFARIVILGLIAGGACGAGVALRLYPAIVGVIGAAVTGVFVGVAVRRLKAERRAGEGNAHDAGRG